MNTHSQINQKFLSLFLLDTTFADYPNTRFLPSPDISRLFTARIGEKLGRKYQKSQQELSSLQYTPSDTSVYRVSYHTD